MRQYESLPEQTGKSGVCVAHEYKIVALRDCPLPRSMQLCDTPGIADYYWKRHIATLGAFTPDVEWLAILILNTRLRIKGHAVVAMGGFNSLIVTPCEVFRPAVIAAASGILIMHNHPSGESQPSEADIAFTKRLVQIGDLLQIPVIDHVVIGNGEFTSLRETGMI